MAGDPAQRRTESKSAQSTINQRHVQKAGDPTQQANSGITYRVGKRFALWSDLARRTEVHSFPLATAWG